ncbi:MAG: hypothetical protein JSV93_06350 [Candidatus Omnitrophota bacterium]|nr:MAG: hypothetical protein JSV93_06350 [Candidatus Omnitrophota bacterium]
MRVIIILGKKNEKRHFMFELPDKKAKEIKKLLNTRKRPEVISNIMSMGKFVKKLTPEELAHVASDLILTDTSAHWNLAR